jgi:hypothetical protein
MDQKRSSLYLYSELVSLKKIETEFWNCLNKNLQHNQHYEHVNLKPLIKLQKTINNTMMRMISTTTDELGNNKPTVDSVDEVEGFVMTQPV